MKNKFPKQLMMYSFLVMAGLAALLFACNKSGGGNLEGNGQLNADAAINAVANSTEQHHTMAEFLEVTKEYQTRRWDVINQKLGIEDAKSIWFSLDRLQNFISGIEKSSATLNIQSKDLGVRLYYGVYKNNPEYAGLHTIFIVPTYNGVDFDPIISASKKKVITLVDLSKNTKQEADI